MPVSTRHRFDIHTTSITLKQRRTDVKTEYCESSTEYKLNEKDRQI